MSVTETLLSWLVDVVGIQGVSVAALVVLLAVAGIASKISSLFRPAGKAVHAGSTASNGLAHIKFTALTLVVLSVLGITSLNPEAAISLYEGIKELAQSIMGSGLVEVL